MGRLTINYGKTKGKVSCTNPGPFFKNINGWAGEKRVVPCSPSLSSKDRYPK